MRAPPARPDRSRPTHRSPARRGLRPPRAPQPPPRRARWSWSRWASRPAATTSSPGRHGKTVARRMTEASATSALPAQHRPGDRRASRAGQDQRYAGEVRRQGQRQRHGDQGRRRGLMQVPEANASYTPKASPCTHADIAMAVAVPGGLITPIIRAAEPRAWPPSPPRPRTWPSARTKKLKPRSSRAAPSRSPTSGMFGIRSFARSSTSRRARSCPSAWARNGRWCAGDQLAIATVMTASRSPAITTGGGQGDRRAVHRALKPLIEDPITMIV